MSSPSHTSLPLSASPSPSLSLSLSFLAPSRSGSIVRCTEKPGSSPRSPILAMHECTIHQEAFKCLLLTSNVTVKTPMPNPHSQSFAQSYGSMLVSLDGGWGQWESRHIHVRHQPDGEAFGNPDKVTITAAHPCLVESHYIHIQSAGIKSHGVSTL